MSQILDLPLLQNCFIYDTKRQIVNPLTSYHSLAQAVFASKILGSHRVPLERIKSFFNH
jgi:hypothetical protein